MLGMKTSHLTSLEEAELQRLESVLTRGLQAAFESGKALARIRDGQLYRATHESFEAYCNDRWKLTARRAYQLIAAAGVAENVNPGTQLTEKAARELASLTPEDQKETWLEVLDEHGKETPVPAALVRKHAAARKPAKKKARKAPKPLRVKVPGGIVIIERRTADLDPAMLLSAALAKLSTRSEAA